MAETTRNDLLAKCAKQIEGYDRIDFNTLADVGRWNRENPEQAIAREDVIAYQKESEERRIIMPTIGEVNRYA